MARSVHRKLRFWKFKQLSNFFHLGVHWRFLVVIVVVTWDRIIASWKRNEQRASCYVINKSRYNAIYFSAIMFLDNSDKQNIWKVWNVWNIASWKSSNSKFKLLYEGSRRFQTQALFEFNNWLSVNVLKSKNGSLFKVSKAS